MLIFLLIASTVLNALAGIAIHILVKEIYKHQEAIQGILKELDGFYEKEQELEHELYLHREDIKDLEHELEGLNHELTISLEASCK